MMRLCLLVIVAALCAGCARHVVVEPSQAAILNSPDWTVKSEPRAPEPTKKDTQ